MWNKLYYYAVTIAPPTRPKHLNLRRHYYYRYQNKFRFLWITFLSDYTIISLEHSRRQFAKYLHHLINGDVNKMGSAFQGKHAIPSLKQYSVIIRKLNIMLKNTCTCYIFLLDRKKIDSDYENIVSVTECSRNFHRILCKIFRPFNYISQNTCITQLYLDTIIIIIIRHFSLKTSTTEHRPPPSVATLTMK